MKIPARRPAGPGRDPERGKWRELSPVLRTNCCLPAKLKQFTLPDCPSPSLSHSLSPCLAFPHFSVFIWNIFRIRCNWRINFVRFDAPTQRKMLNSLQVACHNCPTVSAAVPLYHYFPVSHSLSLTRSGTETICISIFEQLNINESPQQLRIAVGNSLFLSLPRNTGF